MNNQIDEIMKGYVDNQELAGAALCVYKNGQEILNESWGYSCMADKTPIQADSIYRMMSMTKVLTAVAVMICVERGLMGLDDPVSKFVPEFKEMRVSDDERYVFQPEKMKKIPLMLLTFSMKKVKTRPAKREVTIRDLLSHSSGLQQGLCGLLEMIKNTRQYATLKDFVLHYTENVLDFDPGEGTGYSPLAGFDVLGYLVSVVSGVSLEEFISREICAPLGMKDTTFFLNDEQKSRLVHVYKRVGDKLTDVTGTKDDMCGALHQKALLFEHGCGGIFSTLPDYTRFARMLLQDGELDGARILKAESVRLMQTEAPQNHLEPEPGFVWGLGVKIRQNPEKGHTPATQGTYGWSGAFGTHFFVSPQDNLTAIFMTNRSDLNGAGSYISQKVEELVFGLYGEDL